MPPFSDWRLLTSTIAQLAELAIKKALCNTIDITIIGLGDNTGAARGVPSA